MKWWREAGFHLVISKTRLIPSTAPEMGMGITTNPLRVGLLYFTHAVPWCPPEVHWNTADFIDTAVTIGGVLVEEREHNSGLIWEEVRGFINYVRVPNIPAAVCLSVLCKNRGNEEGDGEGNKVSKAGVLGYNPL